MKIKKYISRFVSHASAVSVGRAATVSLLLPAVLLPAVLLFAACSADGDDLLTAPVAPADSTWVLTVEATLPAGDYGDTRGTLTQSGTTLTTAWQTTDRVYVYHGYSRVGELKPTSISSRTATLTGTLTRRVPSGDVLRLQYNYAYQHSYATQSGTLADIQANHNLYDASVTVSARNDDTHTVTLTAAPAFTPCQSITKLTTTQSVSSLLIEADGMESVAITPASAATVFYVALPPLSNKTVTITASKGSTFYGFTKAATTLTAGKYYQQTASLTTQSTTDLMRPLTLQPVSGSCNVELRTVFSINSSTTASVEYSLDDGTSWQTVTLKNDEANTLETVSQTVTIPSGKTMLLRNAVSRRQGYYSTSQNCLNIRPLSDCYAYGNVMSLLDGIRYPSVMTISRQYAFYELFKYAALCSHPTLQLRLPATTLANWCYEYMFDHCTRMSRAPALPATKLAQACYHRMFSDCTNLTTAPALPATTLANYCYQEMFYRCTSLTTAPDLPATTLANFCYYGMFCYCSNLQSVKAMMLDAPSNIYTYDWLNGVKSSGTFTMNERATWNNSSLERGSTTVPTGWIIRKATQ